MAREIGFEFHYYLTLFLTFLGARLSDQIVSDQIVSNQIPENLPLRLGAETHRMTLTYWLLPPPGEECGEECNEGRDR